LRIDMIWIIFVPIVLLLLRLLTLRGKRSDSSFYGLGSYHYAHRGLHSDTVPENSMTAFSLAVSRGYGAELDVHLTKDRKLVVFHDETLVRMTGDNRRVEQCTYAELSQLRLKDTDERIPLLQEVLPLFEGKTPLIIELKAVKGNHAALARRVCKLLDDFPKLQFCTESFDPRVLRWLKKHRPEIVRGQLSCNFIRTRSGLPLPLAFFLTGLWMNFLTVPHFVAYRFSDRKRLAVRLCRLLWGTKLVAWTVHTDEEKDAALSEHMPIIFEHILP